MGRLEPWAYTGCTHIHPASSDRMEETHGDRDTAAAVAAAVARHRFGPWTAGAVAAAMIPEHFAVAAAVAVLHRLLVRR